MRHNNTWNTPVWAEILNDSSWTAGGNHNSDSDSEYESCDSSQEENDSSKEPGSEDESLESTSESDSEEERHQNGPADVIDY